MVASRPCVQCREQAMARIRSFHRVVDVAKSRISPTSRKRILPQHEFNACSKLPDRFQLTADFGIVCGAETRAELDRDVSADGSIDVGIIAASAVDSRAVMQVTSTRPRLERDRPDRRRLSPHGM